VTSVKVRTLLENNFENNVTVLVKVIIEEVREFLIPALNIYKKNLKKPEKFEKFLEDKILIKFEYTKNGIRITGSDSPQTSSSLVSSVLILLGGYGLLHSPWIGFITIVVGKIESNLSFCLNKLLK
jgi:hypothetical protein